VKRQQLPLHARQQAIGIEPSCQAKIMNHRLIECEAARQGWLLLLLLLLLLPLTTR
jgi:hypothetical protein